MRLFAVQKTRRRVAVPDLADIEGMAARAFHQALSRGAEPSEAMRAAQLQMLDGPIMQWASMVMVEVR